MRMPTHSAVIVTEHAVQELMAKAERAFIIDRARPFFVG